MKIAVCITTRNRPDVFEKIFRKHQEFLSKNPKVEMKILIVDDASETAYAIADHRFHRQAGVARAKNKCLELAYDWGADHIFLFDDDCYPIAYDWWKPYVEHKEPHLMYQFKLPGKPETDMRELYRDNETVAYSHTRGAMIYVTKEVLDTVGGMDVRYHNGFEHPDWTNRIHNAGLTTYRAMDVPNSHKLLYCLDQDGIVESSIKDSPKRDNYRLYDSQRQSKEYREFRHA